MSATPHDQFLAGERHDDILLFLHEEAVGDIYAEGDVIHAYAACECGTTYSDKWVVGGPA